MGAKQRRAVAEKLSVIPEGEERVLLATGRYIGEGFDDAQLDTLFLAMPISWRGTLQQYVGRLHRLHANKREVQVYDYVDGAVPVFTSMFEKRLRGYAAAGYEVLGDWENLPAPLCLPPAGSPSAGEPKSQSASCVVTPGQPNRSIQPRPLR